MVNCSEFLHEYSSFRDGRMSRDRAGEFRAHLGACASCSRYDRVIGGGVELVRDLEVVEPSPDFMGRLQHRLYHVEDEMRASRRASGSAIALTVAIAGAVGIFAWAPTMRPTTPQLRLPAVAANAPVRTETVPSVFRAGPLLTDAPGGQGMQTLFFRYSPLGVHTGQSQAVLAAQGVAPR